LAASPALSRSGLDPDRQARRGDCQRPHHHGEYPRLDFAIDHFGFLNTPVHEANFYRIAGGALMVAGIALISRF
jgi:hypothetical protein